MVNARVLVVDDNEANRSLARATLEDEGYTVITANGGKEGLALFASEKPDCILLDIRMPDLDGFAVCEQLRKLPHGPETPVLFFTAVRDVDTFDHALRAGGDDYLTKPVRPTELVVRVQTALALRRTKAELREHYELLKRQRDDLQRLQLQKERLTAFVVHDLKNPVNTMDLHAQVLLRDKSLSEDARDSALQIRSEARQLTRMILNLLDVSKADEGALAPRRHAVDLEALVASLASELSAAAKSRDVELVCALDAKTLSADEDLLRRVLANLLENAVRHTPAKTRVTVSAKHADGATDLGIADEGPGIPKEMRERVFEPFVQAEATRTGRGLGLTFCRLAVEAHGGRIWIEDGETRGTVFRVRIPDER